MLVCQVNSSPLVLITALLLRDPRPQPTKPCMTEIRLHFLCAHQGLHGNALTRRKRRGPFVVALLRRCCSLLWLRSSSGSCCGSDCRIGA